MPSPARDRPIASYVTVTFAFSWAVWTLGFLAFEGSALGFAAVVVGGFGPMVGAATVLKRRGRSLREWFRETLTVRIAPRWYALAVAVPLVFAGAHAAYLAARGASFDPGLLAERLPLFLGAVAFTFFLGGGQEEFGWRGFMLPRLRAARGSLAASLVVGVVWAFWHLPLFVLPGGLYADQPFVTYVPVVVGLAVVFTWFDNRTGGALPALMLLHAVVNNAESLIPVSPAEMAGYAGSGAYHLVQVAGVTVVIAALLAVDGPSLGADAGEGPPAGGRDADEATADAPRA